MPEEDNIIRFRPRRGAQATAPSDDPDTTRKELAEAIVDRYMSHKTARDPHPTRGEFILYYASVAVGFGLVLLLVVIKAI